MHSVVHLHSSIPIKEASDKMEEECGVFAAYSKLIRTDLVGFGYYGLYALQHRGQESAGITINENNKLTTIKGMGLVSEVFSRDMLNSHNANAMVAHVRYATTGDSSLANAQPLSGHSKLGHIAVAHNGNLVNTRAIKAELENQSVVFHSTTDTEVILNLLARNASKGLQDAITTMCNDIKGAFALVMLIQGKLIGIRDPLGIRPLCLGQILNTEMYILASETCALDAVGAEFVRDIEPGEIVIIDDDGIQSIKYANKAIKAPCSFEYIYFSRPDSIIDEIDTYSVRYKAGKFLYLQQPVAADVVIGVPDSGVAAAIGYSEISKIPYGVGLVKSKYVGRSFILPSQELREQAVKVKLNPIKQVINGKRVVVVDDSLVRGTTAKKLIVMLREAGAVEIHYRLASPVVKNQCYFGIDIASKKELIGSSNSIAQICQEIGADTLEYLTLANLSKSIGGDNYCMGCFTGHYPVKDIEFNDEGN